MSERADDARGTPTGAQEAIAGHGTGQNPVLAWLHSEGARFAETAPFVAAFAERLLGAGIDLWRLTTGIHILHPQIDASSCLWQKGKPVTERRFRLTQEGMRQLQNSPMPIVYGGASFRRRLESAPEPGNSRSCPISARKARPTIWPCRCPSRTARGRP